MKDYYKILELSFGASETEIKANYRRLSKQWHPDCNPNVDTTVMMQEIVEAYQMLNNLERRQEYDLRYSSYFTRKNEYRSPSRNATRDRIQDDLFEEYISRSRVEARDIVTEFMSDFKKRGKNAQSAAWGEAKKQGVHVIIMVLLFHLLAAILFLFSN